MSLAQRLLEQMEGLGVNPLKYQQDYPLQTKLPIKQIDQSAIPEDLFCLFKKFSYSGLPIRQFFMLTSGRPENIAKVRNGGTLLGRRKGYECWSFENDYVFTDGKNLYSPSEKTLIYINLSKAQ